MKKLFKISTLFLLLFGTLHADALKNSLSSMLEEKEDSSMVNLSNLNLNNKAPIAPPMPKSRPSNAVIASVNAHKVLKKEADAYLHQRTNGKVDDFDTLPPNQKKRLVTELSFPILILDAAKKELTQEEKQAIYTQVWMKKEALKITVTDEQAMVAYDEILKQAREQNATDSLPPFDKVKDKLILQVMEKEIIAKLLRNATIEVK